jgi:hypothetical protein
LWRSSFIAIAISGCSGGDASWRGEIKGEYKLRVSSGDKDASVMDAGKAVLTFIEHENEKDKTKLNRLKFGVDTPLPECSIAFYPGNAKRDSPGGVHTALVYKVNRGFQVYTDDNSWPLATFCVGRGDKDSKLVPATIEGGELAIDESGKLSGFIDYTVDATNERRTSELTGSKGWF